MPLRHFATLLLITTACLAADGPKAKKARVVIVPADLNRDTPVLFDKEVLPLFVAKCQACHAGKITEGNLDLSTYAGLMKGGDHGAMIVVGNAEESYAYSRAGHLRGPIMPPADEGEPFTPVELAVLRLWIVQGAKPPAVDAKLARTVKLHSPASQVVPVRALAFSPNGATLAVGRGNQLHLVDVKSGEVRQTLLDPVLRVSTGEAIQSAHVSLVEAVAFSPDGKTLASGSYRELTLWDMATGTVRRRLSGFADRVVAIAYSPDGKTFATAGGAPSEDGEVKLFDADGGDPRLITNSHTDTAYGVAFHPKGGLLATCGADRFVKIFDTKTLAMVKSFEGHIGHVLDVGWLPDGKTLVSCGADPEKPVKFWNVEKGEKARDMAMSVKQVTRMAFVGTAPLFLLACGDGVARLCNAESATQIRGFDSAKICLDAATATVDGKIVATGGQDGVVRLFQLADAKLLKTLTFTTKK